MERTHRQQIGFQLSEALTGEGIIYAMQEEYAMFKKLVIVMIGTT